jgi:hypothetical protein
VLLHGGTAVLAVDENLRYGPMKSGYHGGASPAEAVVPVTVLVSGDVPSGSGLRLAPPQEPSWWTDPVLITGAGLSTASAASRAAATRTPTSAPASKPASDLAKRPGEAMDTLFEVPEPASQPGAAAPESAKPASSGPAATADMVLASPAYKENKKRAGRITVSDAKVCALLAALTESPSHRLSPVAAASALEESPVMLRGAITQVQQLLNIDGAAVVRIDADGATVILDGAALAEQYGVSL